MGRAMYDEHSPTLNEARASAPEVPKHHNKKNRQRWCRGKVGVEHSTELRMSKWHQHRVAVGHQPQGCQWWPWGRNSGYQCFHERVCTECGRIVKHKLYGRECPYYVPVDQQD